jgi:hypothetical protein
LWKWDPGLRGLRIIIREAQSLRLIGINWFRYARFWLQCSVKALLLLQRSQIGLLHQNTFTLSSQLTIPFLASARPFLVRSAPHHHRRLHSCEKLSRAVLKMQTLMKAVFLTFSAIALEYTWLMRFSISFLCSFSLCSPGNISRSKIPSSVEFLHPDQSLRSITYCLPDQSDYVQFQVE